MIICTDPAAGRKEWTYNGLDVCVTREIFDNMLPELTERQLQLYTFNVAAQNVAVSMQLAGLGVDEYARMNMVVKLQDEARGLKKKMDEFVKKVRGEKGVYREQENELGVLSRNSEEAQNELDRITEEPKIKKPGKKTPDLELALAEWATLNEAQKEKKKAARGKVSKARKAWRDASEKLGREKEGFKWEKGFVPSVKQLTELFYGLMKLPVRHGESGNPTVDEDALIALGKNPKAKELCDLLLKAREMQKQVEALSSTLSPDGRIRCSFNVVRTVTDRWSGSKDVFDRGCNLQNQSRVLRSVYVADPGCVFVNVDLSQAESRCVSYISGEEKYIEAHETGNVHVEVGKLIFPNDPIAASGDKKLLKSTPYPGTQLTPPLPGEKPSTSYYDCFKSIQHGSNYKLSPRGLGQMTNMHWKDAEDAQRRYFSKFPRIRSWHAYVEEQLKLTGKLISPLGRERTFFGRYWDASTIREAIAHGPQHLSSSIQKAILWRLYKTADPSRIKILVECHDSVLCQVKEGDIESIDFIKNCFEVKIEVSDIWGNVRWMHIPYECEVGVTWGS